MPAGAGRKESLDLGLGWTSRSRIALGAERPGSGDVRVKAMLAEMDSVHRNRTRRGRGSAVLLGWKARY